MTLNESKLTLCALRRSFQISTLYLGLNLYLPSRPLTCIFTLSPSLSPFTQDFNDEAMNHCPPASHLLPSPPLSSSSCCSSSSSSSSSTSSSSAAAAAGGLENQFAQVTPPINAIPTHDDRDAIMDASSGGTIGGLPFNGGADVHCKHTGPRLYAPHLDTTTSSSGLPYCPTMCRQDNPHYYAINQQLYYAHREAVERLTHHNQ